MPSHVSKYGTIFKFGKDDLIVNRIKTHPKVEFFIHTSSIYYNSSNQELENSNTKNGHTNLYELNVNRPDSQLIYPFINKRGNFTSFNTISTENFMNNYENADEIAADYVLTSSIAVNRFGTEFSDAKRDFLYPLKNTLNFYTTLSPHFAYSSSFGDKETQALSIVSVPSIFYGSSIRKGSVKLKYYITGTLVGEASDTKKNGELIQTSGSTTGQCVGVILYNEGFLMLTASAALSDETDSYTSDEGLAVTNPSWYYFAMTKAYLKAPKSSYKIEFEGVNYVETLTMFAHAKERELNFSNNPTFASASTAVATGSSFYTQDKKVGIKNIASSSYSDYSASFKPITYISKVGVYDKDRNLIAIASLANPVKKIEEQSYTFKLKLDI
jgi:hypothetical protein